MRVYTSEYLKNEFGYIDDDEYNLIVSICNDDNECCYCCDIDSSNNLHMFGAKFEIYNNTDIVSFDTVIDELQFNDYESIILKNIISCNGDINHIKSICIGTHTMFNDEYINIQSYVNSIISKNKYFSNFDILSSNFEKLNDKVIALLVVDESNALNQYRCCIDTQLNVSIQYIDKSTDDVIDLIDFKVNTYDLNVILNEMFIHLYMYMYVEHFTIDN